MALSDLASVQVKTTLQSRTQYQVCQRKVTPLRQCRTDQKACNRLISANGSSLSSSNVREFRRWHMLHPKAIMSSKWSSLRFCSLRTNSKKWKTTTTTFRKAGATLSSRWWKVKVVTYWKRCYQQEAKSTQFQEEMRIQMREKLNFNRNWH